MTTTVSKLKRILVVDDEIDILDLCQEHLEDRYQVVKTNSPFEALAFVKEARNQIDLIILDLNLPGMSGLEFLEGLRDLKCKTPIVLYTGSGIPKSIPEHVVGAFEKPLGMHLIGEEIDKILARCAPARIEQTKATGQNLYLENSMRLLESILKKHGCAHPEDLNFSTAMAALGNSDAYSIYLAWSSLRDLSKRIK